jgi:hypothetical protein
MDTSSWATHEALSLETTAAWVTSSVVVVGADAKFADACLAPLRKKAPLASRAACVKSYISKKARRATHALR